MSSLLSSIFGDKGASSSTEVADSLFSSSPTMPSPAPAPVVIPKTKRTNRKNSKKKTTDSIPDDDVEMDESEGKGNDIEETTDKNSNAKNSNDDDAKTIFVGNLPLGTTRKDLARLFRDCGSIQSTRIRSVATDSEAGVKLPPHLAGKQGLVKQVLVNQNKLDASTKATVLGYVVFENQESVEKALLMNNTPVPAKTEDGTNTITTTNRRMRVDRVNKEYDARRSVFVGNMPYQADEEGLRACFVQNCQNWNDEDIDGVRIVRDKQTHQCKGFGYLLFKDTTMVATALRTMDGVEYLGRPLRVRVCGKRFKTRSQDEDTNKNKKSMDKPVAVALKQMVTHEQLQQQQQNKRKRGVKKAHSTGKSKRAVAEAKTNQRIKQIEKRIRKGMGKMRKK